MKPSVLHLCGHNYHQDCMRRPPTIEQINASVCPLCATHVLYSVVGQASEADTETRFDVLYLLPRARTIRRLALAMRTYAEIDAAVHAMYPTSVPLSPDALDMVLAGRQPKQKV